MFLGFYHNKLNGVHGAFAASIYFYFFYDHGAHGFLHKYIRAERNELPDECSRSACFQLRLPFDYGFGDLSASAQGEGFLS